MRIDLSGFFAYISANLINSYILTRWKVLLKGRKFWLRSSGSSIFSEALYSIIAVLLIEMNSFSTENITKLIFTIYIIKVIFTIIFGAPASLLVTYLKKVTGMDVYDLPNNFTPFKYKKLVEDL